MAATNASRELGVTHCTSCGRPEALDDEGYCAECRFTDLVSVAFDAVDSGAVHITHCIRGDEFVLAIDTGAFENAVFASRAELRKLADELTAIARGADQGEEDR
jgi:hypothetical protein